LFFVTIEDLREDVYAVFVETQDAKAIKDKVIATFDQQVQDSVIQ